MWWNKTNKQTWMYIHMFMDTCRYLHVPIVLFKGCFQKCALTSVLAEVAETEIEFLPGDVYYN